MLKCMSALSECFCKQESLANAKVSARQLLAVVWRPLPEERPA